MKKRWFEFKAEVGDPAAADVYIFGLIGDFIDDLFGFEAGITTAKSFVDELAALPEAVKTVRIHINSPGGDAMGGVTIANALRAEQGKGRTIEAIVEGLAASAASIVAMGANKGKLRMADNALMMVHSPWSIAIGNAQEMRATADVLDQYEAALVKTYGWHSDLSEAEILDLVHGKDGQGTWLSADDAVTFGLADEIVTGLKAAAALDPRAAKLNVPEAFKARVEALLVKNDEEGAGFHEHSEDAAPEAPATEEPAAPEAPTPVEEQPATDEPAPADAVLEMVEAAGLGVPFARALMTARASKATVAASIAAEKDKATKEAARGAAIRAACAAAKQSDMADELIASGATVEAAKALVQKVLAKLDGATEIVTALGPDDMAKGGSKVAADLNPTKVYAERNLRLVKE